MGALTGNWRVVECSDKQLYASMYSFHGLEWIDGATLI